MKFLLIGVLLMLSPSWVLAADDKMEKFLHARRAYLESLRITADGYLDEVHKNASAEIRARVPLQQVRLDIREGMDFMCHADGFIKIGYVIHQSKTIVVCEEDVAAASHYQIGLVLIMGSLMQENWALFEKQPKDAPLPENLNRQMKGRLLRLAEYLADTNRRVKNQKFVTKRYGLQACRAWEAVYRLVTKPDALNACTRNDLTRSESLEAARWSAEILRFSIGRSQEKMLGAKPAQDVVRPIDPIEAEAAMNQMWSEVVDRMLYYAVAHEFGHLATGAVEEAKLSEIERERIADRFAASAINEFQARAVALPMLAHTLEVLWTSSKAPAIAKGRAQQLGVVVFCERGLHLRSSKTTPMEENFLRMMADEHCKGKSVQ
jgi:hypothetical protein